MKSKQSLDEICFADEIKSVLQPDEVGFHHKVISSIGDGFLTSVRTDLVKKERHAQACLSFFGAPDRNRTCTSLRKYGPEPYASASSATGANIKFSLAVAYRVTLAVPDDSILPYLTCRPLRLLNSRFILHRRRSFQNCQLSHRCKY